MTQEFETPADALAHYGVLGMKWGVRKDDRSGSKRGSGSKKLSDDDLGGLLDEFYSKKSQKELNATGKAKLKAQAANDFPAKKDARQGERDAKADKVTKKADKTAQDLEQTKKMLAETPRGPAHAYERYVLKDRVNYLESRRAALIKKSEQIRAGKLTDGQKLAIGIGVAAAVTVLAVYGSKKYNLHKLGIDSNLIQQAKDLNQKETASQWVKLFGGSRAFEPAASAEAAFSGGQFYQTLKTKSALDIPEFTIPKETWFQRLSNHDEDTSEYVKGAYSTFLSNDKKLYASSYEFGSKAYAIKFRPKENVKVPTLKTTLAHLKTVERGVNPNVTDAQVLSLYHVLAGGSWRDKTAQSLLASLKADGYSAIVDHMDAGYLADLPVVFFGDVAESVGSVRSDRDKALDAIGLLKLASKYAS